MKKPLRYPGECCASGGPTAKNPRGLRPLGFWPWDLPRHSIHHDTSSAFTYNVPDLKLPTHRPVCHYCQQTLGKKIQNWGPHLYSKINYMKYVINYFIITLLLKQVGNILLELKHVLGLFVTIMNICKWMLSVESLEMF